MENLNLKLQCEQIITELIEKAKLQRDNILVVGCSTSEVIGEKIGTNSSEETAKELFDGIYSATKKHGIRLAIQCCEHLNRAIVCEKETAQGHEVVNVVPQKKAGGSLATVAYNSFNNPVVIEEIKADAGIDIGGTLIGMHLKKVAVPLRLSVNKIGKANILCARVRPKFIGGIRAIYNEELL